MRNMGRRTGEDEQDEEDEDIEMFRGPEDLRIVWQTGVTFVTRPNLSSLFQFKVSKEKATGNLVIVGSSHPGITVSDIVSHINGTPIDIYAMTAAGNSTVLSQYKQRCQGYLKIAVRWKRRSGDSLKQCFQYDEHGQLEQLYDIEEDKSSSSSSSSSTSKKKTNKKKTSNKRRKTTPAFIECTACCSGSGKEEGHKGRHRQTVPKGVDIRKKTTSKTSSSSTSSSTTSSSSSSTLSSTPTTYNVPPPFSFLHEDGDLTEALKAYEMPLRSYCIRAGELLEERGRYREAICFYQRACSLSTNQRAYNILEEVNDLSNLGLAYRRCGNLQSAHVLYLHALYKIEHVDVAAIQQCGGGNQWMATRDQYDHVYEECKNHNKPSHERRQDIFNMVNKHMRNLIHEMNAWSGTGKEYSHEIEQYEQTKRGDVWLSAQEEKWKLQQRLAPKVSKKKRKKTN